MSAQRIECQRYMSRKKRPLPLIENVTITGIAAEGKAVARVDDMVVFVPFAVPGDVVDLQLTRKKHSYCEATVARYVALSEHRVEPRCRHFGVCGGCKWQNLPYAKQLEAKQQQVVDQLTRIGKIELPHVRTILGSARTFHYRNKLEFGCSNRRWLTKEEMNSNRIFDDPGYVGFHVTGSFDKILPIEECVLMDDEHNAIRNTIRDFALQHSMTFFDARTQKGLLRDIVIRRSSADEWMLLVQFHFDESNDKALAMQLLDHMAEHFPKIVSLLWVDNQKCNDTFGDLETHLYKGANHIIESMDGLRFKVGPKSFYQTNSEQASALYTVARDMAQLDGSELVYDLYTGIGTIANFVARQARRVVGIEYVEEAIIAARENSILNGIDNTTFYAGDMKDILNDDFIAKNGAPDVVITDPPRAGMHPDVVKTIMRAQPKRIVYVSCNPATQARDIGVMAEMYHVVDVQPVDMFPHTPHVENVVLLEKNGHIGA